MNLAVTGCIKKRNLCWIFAFSRQLICRMATNPESGFLLRKHLSNVIQGQQAPYPSGWIVTTSDNALAIRRKRRIAKVISHKNGE